MRYLLLLSGLAGFALVASLPVRAEPSILGPTGLLVSPTADITPLDHAWIALNFLDNDDAIVWNANVTTSVSDSFEVGAGFSHPDSGDDGFTVFVKYLFYPETENVPGAATGLTVTDYAGFSSTMWYAVVSKFFMFGKEATDNASIHGGVSYVAGDGDDDFCYFGGLDAEIFQNLLAIVEYQSGGMSPFNGLSFGVRYYLSPQLTGQAGFIDGDLHFGASFVF